MQYIAYIPMRNTILVTGGAGFIGSTLCRELCKDPNNYVLCLDNYSNFEFIRYNILDDLHILDVFKINQIYHLACPASPPAYQKDPLYTIQVNTTGAFNVLNLAERHQARILYTSTSEIYGDPQEHPQKETYWGNVHTMGPRSCYDEGKRVGETIFYEYNKNRGVEVRIARIFNTYGPYMSPEDGRVITNFTKQALSNADITIYGDGSQTRSICYVTDTVNGLMKLMNGDHMGPFNIGNPVEMSIKELAEYIIELTESQSKLSYHPLPVDDPTKRRPDISKAKELLDWEPVVSAEVGLLRTIRWIKDKI